MQNLIVERAATWGDAVELAPDLKLKRGCRDEELVDRPLAVLRCGPLLGGGGQAYDQRQFVNLEAAISKNLPEQVPPCGESDDVMRRGDEFAKRLIEGTLDAWENFGMYETGIGWGRVLTDEDVIAHVRRKDPAKAKAYAEAYAEWSTGAVQMFGLAVWVGSIFVKAEYLKEGKLPRCIFNSQQHDVVLCHHVILLFDEWLKAARPTFKGLTQSQKGQPFEKAARVLGSDMHVLLLDDTARDGNTVDSDFDRFVTVLEALGMLRPHMPVAQLLRRRGVKASALGGILRSVVARLPSGVSFTSTINAVTTLWSAFVVCEIVMGFARTDWIVLPEGDDNAICIRNRAWAGLRIRVEDAALRGGRLLRKQLKVEGHGPWTNGSLPHVGSLIGEYNGIGYAFHSWGRMTLKASVCVGNIDSVGTAAGMVVARADALVDRYDGCPVGWRIANHVRTLANSLCARAIRTSEEEFNHSEYQHHKRWAGPPDDETRAAYAVVAGVPVWKQELLEAHIASATDNAQWCVDLRHVVEL